MKIKGLAHIGLFVKDIKRSENFYYKYLGFEKIWNNINKTPDGDALVVFIKNGSCIIELVQLPDFNKRQDGYFDHIAIAVEDIDAVIKLLKKQDIDFEEGSYTIAPQVFKEGSKWIMFRGPDGEHLELNELML